jgi:hypothetical protein
MVRRWLIPKVRINSSLPYPCSGGVPRAGEGRVEFSSRWISWDPAVCASASVVGGLALWIYGSHL